MILHCFHLADSLTSLWGLGQTGETSETGASLVRRTRRRSASRSAASCHRPMSLCCQHIQLQGAVWHVRWRANKRRHRQRCMCAGLAPVPELTITRHRCLPAKEKSLGGLRAGSYVTPLGIYTAMYPWKAGEIRGALWKNMG